MSDKPFPEAAIYQHTTNPREEHLYTQRDSKRRFQQPQRSDVRLTPRGH